MFIAHNLQNSHRGHVCIRWLTNEYFIYDCIYSRFPIFVYLHVHYFDRSWSLTVTIRLKLSDSRLQNFAHPAVSINPSQGIYGEAAAALDNRCHNSIVTLFSLIDGLHTSMNNFKTDQDNCCYTCSSLRQCQYLLPTWSLKFESRFGMSLRLSRKQVACRQASPKISLQRKEHLLQPPTGITWKMKMRCAWPLPILVTCTA
jgi:hypothetical protein